MKTMQLAILSLATVFVVVLCGGSTTQAATIAHWSFDTPSLSTDGGGNITGAADSTGSHNAVNTQTAGSGTGSPYSSNTIPGSNSITGKFGQGLTLEGFNNVAGGGGQFMTFPNLTELMTADSAPGAPSYSVSYWVQTTTTNSNQFTVLGDWGNAATNPGRFAYGFGFQFGSGVAQMRGQTRQNTTGIGNGSDIYARAVGTPTLNDGDWHMLTWTFDTTTGQLISYFDANPVETFNSGSSSFNMILSSSPVGTFGLKGDSGNFLNGIVALDETWVFDKALSASSVRSLYVHNEIPEPASAVIALLGTAFAARFSRRRRMM